MVKQKHTYKKSWLALAVTRILLGFVFLWAFLDKTFGLGLATPAAKAWINGGSPTAGFLSKGVNPDSPLAGMFNSLAGSAWVDWLFMIALLGIGLSLILGIGLRVTAVAGTVLLGMMYLALLPLDTNPLVDDHIIYAVMLWVFASGQRKLSLFNWWYSSGFVNKNKWLW